MIDQVNSDKGQEDVDVERFYITLFSALEQTHCTRM